MTVFRCSLLFILYSDIFTDVVTFTYKHKCLCDVFGLFGDEATRATIPSASVMTEWRWFRASDCLGFKSARTRYGLLTTNFGGSTSCGAWKEQSYHNSCWWLLQVHHRVSDHKLHHCVALWLHLGEQEAALQRIIKTAQRITGTQLPSLEEIHQARCSCRAEKKIKDPTHPGYKLLTPLPSGRCYRTLFALETRLTNSFHPTAIKLLKSQHSLPPLTYSLN